jgi:beta-lactam-binding protein with PASTA domain
MKTKDKILEKEFDTVKIFREIKEKISKEMAGMTFEQIKEYLKSNSLKFREP